MRGAIQAVAVVAAGLLLLLSFNLYEPLRASTVNSYERAASSFAASAQLAVAGAPAAAPASVAAASPRTARMAALLVAMRTAAAREDFDSAKQLKAELDALRTADAASPTPAPSVGSAPAARLSPILARRAVSAPGASVRTVGCLVSAWGSVWLVHPNVTRSFVVDAPADCRARATPADVPEIPKNDGVGRTYELREPADVARACSSAGCPSGPLGAPGRGSEMLGADKACVLAALEAVPSGPVGPARPQANNELVLSAKLIGRYASPLRQIIVTFVNYGYLSFAITWVERLRAAGCNHFLIGAMDDKVLVELRRRGIQAFSIAQGGVVSRDLGWGSQAFKKAQQVKVQMFADVLAHGYDALLADIDAVFVRDPLPYLGCYPEADMLVSSDHLHNSTTDGGLELATSAHATMNVGMIYARARPGALAFMQEWARRCSANLDFWEQAIFNEMAKDKGGLDVLNATLAPRRLFSLWGRKLVGGILPVSLFCSGHTAFVQAMHAQLGFAVPYAYHATFQYSGTRGKRARLREAGVWIDEPSYYDPAGGLLRFTPRLDARLTRAPWVGVSDTARHLALVATQMAAFRDALALARALGRTLLMSPLTCGYDRYWSGMPDGKIPGSALQLPIRPCPMDHLFELERFPEPDTLFREWSLLDNERTPAAVKTSISVASLAELPQGRELRAALTAAGADLGSKVLDMQAVPHYSELFGPADAAKRRDFEMMVKRMPAAFCCNPKGARPIAYQMPLGSKSDRVGPLPTVPPGTQRRLNGQDWNGVGDRY